MANFGIGQIQSTARVLLICPDCGQENSEYVDVLRGRRMYCCGGDGCDYIFDLAGPRYAVGRGFVEACRKFYAAIYALRA